VEEEKEQSVDFNIDRTNLYREETFTDLRVGSIRRLTPVRPDGSVDKTRKIMFVGHTNILTPHGPVPIQNAIPAKELQQAIKKFPQAMEAAMEKLLAEAQKYQAQQKDSDQGRIETPDSRIIVPGR
jgi:hypothetical protein